MRKIGNRILVCVAFFSILFLLFTGSANAAVDFPADEAGISAYVKAKSSIPNLNVAKPAFATIERENITAGYIIGTVAMSGHAEEQYPHVYVSTDGWLVAYYPRARSSSWLLPWYYYSSGPISTTTLSETVKKVCDQIGGSTTGLKYYDFRYPNATKMMLIVESQSGSGTDWFTVTTPAKFTVYKVDWSHYAWLSGYDRPYSKVKLDGVTFSSFSNPTPGGYSDWTGQEYGTFGLVTEFGQGYEHKIEITTKKGRSGTTGRIGLVLEYEE